VSAFPAIAFLWSFEALTGRPTKRLKALPQVAAPLEMPVLEILAAPEEQAVVAPAAVELPQAKPTPAKRVAKAGKATAGKAEVTVMAIANALLKLPSGTAKELAGLANTSERTVRRYKPEALAKVASLAN
jgi:hypothetical protein